MIHRIVPNLNVRDAGAGHDFYVDFLGLRKEFDLGWIERFSGERKLAIHPRSNAFSRPRKST